MPLRLCSVYSGGLRSQASASCFFLQWWLRKMADRPSTTRSRAVPCRTICATFRFARAAPSARSPGATL